MIAWTSQIRDVGGDGLHLIHELISHPAVIAVHVVSEVADVNDGVVDSSLCLFLQPWERLNVLVSHVAEQSDSRLPIIAAGESCEEELRRPSLVASAVVNVFGLRLQVGQCHAMNPLRMLLVASIDEQIPSSNSSKNETIDSILNYRFARVIEGVPCYHD